MRIIYIFLVGIMAGAQLLSAQSLVPITSNDALIRYQQEKEAQLPKDIQIDPNATTQEKRLCQVEREDLTYVNAGDTAIFRIRIDTTGLDTLPGTYSCLNCEDNLLGTTSIQNDTFVFIADLAVEAGFLDFVIEFCNPNGCNTTSFPIIARRNNRSYYPQEELLPAEGIIQLSADAGVLPGPLTCNRFIECEDDYLGKEQRSYFSTYAEPDNDFIYRASRYAGVDSVCVVLCDTFAICDTFHFAFRIQKDTITIPFMDDFSYDSPVPSFDHWLDVDPFVNKHMAETPPSVGVATFDGLNSKGTPYGGDPGPSDFLTSTYIDLSGTGGEVYLTFWLQRRGLVDKPEIQDSMIVEFKTSSGNWIIQDAYEGAPSSQPLSADEPFQFYSYSVPPNYFHDGFQFRFKNLSDRNGIFDTWHLDYVRLSNDQDSTFQDLAFTAQPGFLLKTYTSLPIRHLKGQEDSLISNVLPVNLYNHYFESLQANNSEVRIQETNTSEFFLGGDMDVRLLNNQLANVTNGVPTSITVEPLNDAISAAWNTYIQAFKDSDFNNEENLRFVTEYSFTVEQETSPGYEAVSRNDTVRRTTIFDNYFAYDDGTAETGLITQENTEIAVEYFANEPDVLRAIRLHIPHTSANVSEQEFRLKVWIEQLDDEPEYSQIFNPYYADAAFDSLQGFTTYPLVDDNGNFLPLDLPEGRFYVGWEQVTDCTFNDCIPVGYDRNRPQAKVFISRNAGMEWEPLSQLTPGGALMIRPVVGEETPGFTQTEELLSPNAIFQLYPNPAHDRINLVLADMNYEDYQVEIFNGLGQKVSAEAASPQLSIHNLTPGIYVVKVMNRLTRESHSQRLVVARQ